MESKGKAREEANFCSYLAILSQGRPGKAREAQGGPGKPPEKPGGPGAPREAQGSPGKPRGCPGKPMGNPCVKLKPIVLEPLAA